MRRRPFRPPAGPAQRFQQAQGDLGFMQVNAAAFSQNQLFDAQVRARQAQQAFERAQKQASGGPDFFDRAGQALMSSRFSVGGGGAVGPQIMPLIGRTLSIFGKLTPALQGFTAGLTLGASVAKAFSDSMVDAARVAGEFGRAGLMSGGSPGTIGQLTAMGLPAGQIAGTAAGLRQRLSSDPFAMMAGGFQLPRPFGGADEAKLLQEKIEDLRVTKLLFGAEAQLVKARMLGLDGMLDLINVSQFVQDEQKKAADLNKDIFDERYLQSARDFNASQTQLEGAWKRLEAAFTKPFIQEATVAILGWAQAVGDASKFLNQHADEFNQIAFKMLEGLAGAFGQGDAVKALEDQMKGFKAANDFLNQNQNATQTNTDALNKVAELLMMVVHGGGPRSRGAIPPAILAFNNRQAMQDARLDLRGFRY
jgi:hypothetical protein